MIGQRLEFQNSAALAAKLAHDVAEALRAAIAGKGNAVIAVSGGTTPRQFFAALSGEKLDWGKVKVTLVDERQVGEESERSNARLVKEALIQNEAARAKFVPLFGNPQAAEIGPLDVAVLGMGTDGHTASFFPGGDHLAAALDLRCPDAILPISAPGSGEPRLTFSLKHLLTAQFLALHVQGADKKATLEKALAGDDIDEMPVRAVLQAEKSLDVYWCP